MSSDDSKNDPVASPEPTPPEFGMIVPIESAEPSSSLSTLDAIRKFKTDDLKKGWSSLLGSVKGAAANVKEKALKATASGVLCADCNTELGLLKPNYADHLPEPYRTQKPGLCSDCIQKYVVSCDCGTSWHVDPEMKVFHCPKCTGLTCSDCNVWMGNWRNCAPFLPTQYRKGKAAVCPECAAKYTIHCNACDHDWSINDGGNIISCPKCDGTICFDCNVATDKKNNTASLLPEDVRQGKASLCPKCTGKYTILCPNCGFDWKVHVEKGIITCPLCGLADAVGCTDIAHALDQSKPFLARLPKPNTKQDIVTVAGAIYRRGHPHYLDPMGGFLVLTKNGCYFLGPIDPDSPEMGHRDILMPLSSISAVSALGEGVHTNTYSYYQGLSKKIAMLSGIAGAAGGAMVSWGIGTAVGGMLGNLAGVGLREAVSGPPPKNRLTIGYKEMNRVTVVFDIMDISKEKIETTSQEFRKRLMKFSPEFGLGKKTETPQPEPVSVNQPTNIEKYRVFREGKLLGMFAGNDIESRIERQEFLRTDFVLVPLETFLREIVTPDKSFPLYRDGKRIDQYTVEQIRRMHADGQMQAIDHLLLPMTVFLKRKRQEPQPVVVPNADVYPIAQESKGVGPAITAAAVAGGIAATGAVILGSGDVS